MADIYEALTADRPYRAGLSPLAALDVLRAEQRAKKLCPNAVEALESYLGTLVPGRAVSA